MYTEIEPKRSLLLFLHAFQRRKQVLLLTNIYAFKPSFLFFVQHEALWHFPNSNELQFCEKQETKLHKEFKKSENNMLRITVHLIGNYITTVVYNTFQIRDLDYFFVNQIYNIYVDTMLTIIRGECLSKALEWIYFEIYFSENLIDDTKFWFTKSINYQL